jgi:hypothetical protein
MNNNIIIELREKDSQHKVRNGEYDVLLSKQVVLEEGDTVALKSVMIDTIVQSSGQITIPDDLTLEINYGLYMNHWLENKAGIAQYSQINTAGADISTLLGDGKLCIPYKKIDGVLNEFEYVSTWIYHGINQQNGNCNITYSYIDVNFEIQYLHTFIPIVYYNEPFEDDFGLIICKIGTLQVLTDLTPYGLSNDGIGPTVPTSGLNHYVPYNFKSSFVLPKGVYSPDQLALYLSKMFSENDANPYNATNQYIQNKFLMQTGNFANAQPQPDGSAGTLTENALFIKYQDGGFLSGIDFNTTANDIFIGASQIAIDYTDTTNSFQFSYIHTPLLDAGTGKNLSIKYLTNSDGDKCAIGAHSGIYFTSLIAKDSNNKLFDFWQDILGYDLASMTVGYTGTTNNQFGIPYSNSTWLIQEQPVLGQHITSNYVGMDTAIQKTTSWYKYTTLSEENSAFDSTADPNTTNAIVAPNKLTELQNKFSHYLLELNMKLQNEVIGADDVYRNYSGIINKYYASGSYLYGDESGAIVYEHKGAPLVLRSIKCRILTSDRVADPLLGDDNTIYMQVLKAQQPAK